MGKKLAKVYDVLMDGVGAGLSGHALYDFVTERCDVFSNKRICKASTMAMTDPRIPDRAELERIFSIATDRRIRSAA